MKNEKEWCACDRCGEETKEDVGAWRKTTDRILKRITHEEYIKLRESVPHAYIGGVDDDCTIIPPIIAVEIITYYSKNERTIHLCGKCRKEFEKFMRNGNNG